MKHSAGLERQTESNLSVKLYKELRIKLISGELRPGEALSIRKVAEEYGVSAMPVREALRQLASDQALVGAAKKAYRVPDLTYAEAANLFFVRSVLEGAAVKIAVNQAVEGDFQALEKLAQEMDCAWKAQDSKTFLKSNFLFHNRINSLSGNDTLQSLIEALYVRSGPWLAHGIIDLVDLDAWESDHQTIVQAMRERNAPEACRLVEADAQWGVALYRNQL